MTTAEASKHTESHWGLGTTHVHLAHAGSSFHLATLLDGFLSLPLAKEIMSLVNDKVGKNIWAHWKLCTFPSIIVQKNNLCSQRMHVTKCQITCMQCRVSLCKRELENLYALLAAASLFRVATPPPKWETIWWQLDSKQDDWHSLDFTSKFVQSELQH